MAVPTTGYYEQTDSTTVNMMTNGAYWQLGADRTIDWSISNSWLSVAFVKPDYAMFANALAMISTYADVHFNYIGYFNSLPVFAGINGSEINFAPDNGYRITDPTVWGLAYFPLPGAMSDAPYLGGEGDVYLNANPQSQASTFTFAQGSEGWTLLLHEIGHALGLKHPDDDGGTDRPTFEQAGVDWMDVESYTVMSHVDDLPADYLAHDPATLMILDVLALQYIYGRNMTTNAGDTNYHLENKPYYTTYWDASGNDTVWAPPDASAGWNLFLPYQQLSVLVPTQSGIAYLVGDEWFDQTMTWLAGDIENAVGSGASDCIYGNDTANLLTGAGGNDTIYGEGGNDTAIYAGSLGSFAIHREGDAFIVQDMTGIEGTDSVTGVETLRFSNLNVSLDADGNAGQIVKLLGAVVGQSYAHNPQLIALGMGLLSGGMSLTDVTNFALDAVFAGVRANLDVFERLYMNVFHETPSPAIEAFGVSLFASGLWTQASLATYASNLDLNLQNVGFAGLHDTGIAYSL